MIIAKVASKILPLLMKSVWKQIQPELKPLQKYVNEPNENNVMIAGLEEKQSKMEKDIKLIKNAMKNKESNKKTDDKKWYDD